MIAVAAIDAAKEIMEYLGAVADALLKDIEKAVGPRI